MILTISQPDYLYERIDPSPDGVEDFGSASPPGQAAFEIQDEPLPGGKLLALRSDRQCKGRLVGDDAIDPPVDQAHHDGRVVDRPGVNLAACRVCVVEQGVSHETGSDAQHRHSHWVIVPVTPQLSETR